MEPSSIGIFHKEKTNLLQTKGFSGLAARSRFSTSAMKITEKATAPFYFPNTWPLRNVCRMLCSPPFLGAEKSMTPTTICVSPSPLINNRSLNTPHQGHYSSYLLISAFWGGVVKDHEAPFSPNYVHLRSHVITRFFFFFFLICKSCGILILVVILCKLSTWPPIVTFRLYECNRFQLYF